MAYLHFVDETGATYGSFEVYWVDDSQAELSGWYWHSCFPSSNAARFGCLPDSDPNGPFETYETALEDALRI